MGVLSGVVVDLEGNPVEGVAVEVAGSRELRQAATGSAGRFRFPQLSEGSYQVSADLLGLAASAESVAVYIGKTSEIELVLGEDRSPAEGAASGEVEDRIQVIALAPLLDPFDTRIGTVVRREFLDQLPVERIYQSVALLLPGVAGGEDGNPNVSGALRGSNLNLIDGVDTTDPTTGLFGLNLSYEAVQAVEVTTSGAPVEVGRASGAVINVVTRSGGNEFQGSARWIATNPAWNSAYQGPEPATAHLAPELFAANAGENRLDSTLGLTLGGPLWADRLWFFAAYEDGETSFLRPTRDSRLWDEGAGLESEALKLTWQAAASHSIVLQRTADSAEFSSFSPFDRGPAENRAGRQPTPLGNSLVNPIPGDIFALQKQSQDGSFTKVQWHWTRSQNSTFEMSLARQDRELLRGRLNSRGLSASSPHVVVTQFDPAPPGEEDIRIREVVLYNGLVDQGFEKRPREQGHLAVNHFFRSGEVDHEFLAGVDVQRTESERLFNVPGVTGVDRATGRAAQGQIFLDVDLRPRCVLLGECVPFDADNGNFQPLLLLNFWQRDPRHTRSRTVAFYASDSLSGKRWLLSGGVRVEEVQAKDDAGRRLVEDRTWAPRLGFKYDPVGSGQVLLSAQVGRFYEPFSHEYLDTFGRSEVFSGFTEYSWLGTLGFDCSEQDPSNIDSFCWFPSDATGFLAIQPAEPNRSLRRSYVDELILGFERQLTSHTAVRLHYVDRRWGDLWDNIQRFDPSGVGRVVSEVDNLPQAERTYRAFQLLLQRRYRAGWQMLGSYTFSESEGNLFRTDGLDTFADFAGLDDANLVNRVGPAPYDRPHRLRLFGNYQKPWKRANLSLGTAIRLDSGTPYEAIADDPFGQRFLSPRGDFTLPDVFQWDFSAVVNLKPSDALEVELKVEVFNVSNEQRQVGAVSELNTGLFGRPRSIVDLQAPRSFRMTLGLRF
ncbi:MAG: TonB-dependent receptor [Deltaproteobacteria bacterium]|nr:TonB-dependent receptor [Deltaproteobacteria bacterium]